MAENQKSFDQMTEHELLQVAEWHAQAMQNSGIISEDTLAERRRLAQKDADEHGERWSSRRGELDLYKKLQYLLSFAKRMAILRKMHLVRLFNSPDWYTKVKVRLTDEFTLAPADKMYDDFEAVRKECAGRISRLVFRTSPFRTLL
jgi:hypothetical protein